MGRRYEGSAASRGYGHRWRKARARYLEKHPLCVKCGEAGHVVTATVVDHIVPHRGDQQLFWDERNWQPMCATHHNSWKQTVERSGIVKGNDTAGRPLDPGHLWNRRRG